MIFKYSGLKEYIEEDFVTFHDEMKFTIERTIPAILNEYENAADFSLLEECSIYIHQSSLSTDFKSILADSGITYSDILNYSLAIIEKKLKRILVDYKSIKHSESSSRQLINALISIINFIYFIYAVAPKVNSTIKLCRIIQQIILFIKDQEVGVEYQHIIFKCIFDNTCSILDKYSVENITPIETLYLLVLMRQLGKYYWLDESTLIKYFKVKVVDEQYKFENNLNYFSITSLLFYVSDKNRYKNLKLSLIKQIETIYQEKKDTLLSDAELVHLTLDLLTCPYVEQSFKNKLLERYGIESSLVKRIASLNKVWFKSGKTLILQKSWTRN